MDQQINRAARELHSWNGIAVIGAGASLRAGFPLTPQLQALLWKAVDADEAIRRGLAARFDRPVTVAKNLIGNDPVLTPAAEDAVLRSLTARHEYQHGFARLNNERVATPSPAHDALAELLHRRVIECVISLNWDTLLEAAYQRRYGRLLRADGHWLYKPHGDAADPDSTWVLPTGGGSIPDIIIQRARALLEEDRPRALLIVGYSESDEEVVTKLIEPLADHWPVIRVGPSATGELAVPFSAERALPSITRAIYPDRDEVPGWEYVTFDNQHDLVQAFLGWRLGPADVVACPRLPEVALVKRQLNLTNSAVILGESGSGKSITAYHAAFDLCQQGWEVLRLAQQDCPTDELLAAVAALPTRSVLVVDDAQALDPRLPRQLLERACDRLAVVVVSTNDMPIPGGGVRIIGERAVATIAADLGRRPETFAAVRKLDSRIGEGYLDLSLEDRLADAAQNATPWQFNFVLTGGERRAYRVAVDLHTSDRADLLLAAVAARQIVLLDASVPRTWLEAVARALGRDSAWVERALDLLRKHEAIIGDGPWRCPHVRFAAVALQHVCTQNYRQLGDLTILLRLAMLHEAPPLRGVFLLLDSLHGAPQLRTQPTGTLVNGATLTYLLERCWAARSGLERGGAALALEQLWQWQPECVAALEAHTALLGRWLEDVTGDAAYGLAELLSSLVQTRRALTEAICEHADPRAVAGALTRATWSDAHMSGALTQATWSDAHMWGYLLRRLAAAASRDWTRRLAAALDRPALRSLVRDMAPSNVAQFEELAMGVAVLGADPDGALSLELVDMAIPTMARALNTTPAETFTQIRDIVWFILGYAPGAFRQRGPSPTQRRVAQRLARTIDPAVVARAIPLGHRREWEIYSQILAFLREVSPQQARQVAVAIDFVALDEATRGLWEQLPSELVALIRVLTMLPGWEPSRSWISRHADEFGRVDPILAAIAPEAVVGRLRAGLPLHLARGSDAFVDWQEPTAVLAALAGVDQTIAAQVADTNYLAIAKGFSTLQANTCEDLALFVAVLRVVAPVVLTKVLQAVDPINAERAWAERLRGGAVERQAAAALLGVIAPGPNPLDPLASVADRLRRRFPRASRTQADDRVIADISEAIGSQAGRIA